MPAPRLPARPLPAALAALLIGLSPLCDATAVGQEDAGPKEGAGPKEDAAAPGGEVARDEAIIQQRAVRGRAEATLERLLAREAADVLPAGKPIAQRGDSLADALHQFGQDAGLPILLDRARLEAQGLDLRDVILGDPPTVPAAVPVTVRRVLGLLLDTAPDVALVALNDGGLLLVTTREHADERLVTRSYDVRDLVRFRSTRAASAGLLLESYGPTPFRGQGGGFGGQGGGTGVGGGGMGSGGGGRGAGGFGGGAFSLPSAGPIMHIPAQTSAILAPAAAGAWQNVALTPAALTPADRAAAEWEARLKFFERRLELLPGKPEDAVYGYDFRPLIDLLQSTTGGVEQGGPWEMIHGEGGAVDSLETGPAGTGRAVLVVRQTDAVHRQIVDLFADLRAAPGDELEPEAAAEPAAEPADQADADGE